MGNGNGGGGGAMIMLLLLGGACCLSVVCIGGVLLMYNTNDDFKATIDGFFGGGGGGAVSSMSGKWVCPDPPQGYEDGYDMKDSDGIWWCQHKQSGDQDISVPLVRNHFRASRLPNPAYAGKQYGYDTIETAETTDGKPGVFGPVLGGFGSKESDVDRSEFVFTAPE